MPFKTLLPADLHSENIILSPVVLWQFLYQLFCIICPVVLYSLTMYVLCTWLKPYLGVDNKTLFPLNGRVSVCAHFLIIYLFIFSLFSFIF